MCFLCSDNYKTETLQPGGGEAACELHQRQIKRNRRLDARTGRAPPAPALRPCLLPPPGPWAAFHHTAPRQTRGPCDVTGLRPLDREGRMQGSGPLGAGRG